MSSIVRFKLRQGVTDAEISLVNDRLGALVGKCGSFLTAGYFDDWAKDINENPDSPQAHMKPASPEYLRKVFGSTMEVGALDIDVSYGRTDSQTAYALASAMLNEPLLFGVLAFENDFLEFWGLANEWSDESGVARLDIRPLAAMVTFYDPGTLNQSRKEFPKDGVVIFRSWGNSEVCVVHGETDYPVAMKDDKYVEREHNFLYRDEKGRFYLTVPKADPSFTAEDIDRFHRRASDLGVVCHPEAFAVCLYQSKITKPAIRAFKEKDFRSAIPETECLQMLWATRNRMDDSVAENLRFEFDERGVATVSDVSLRRNGDVSTLAYVMTMLVAKYEYDPNKINRLLKRASDQTISDSIEKAFEMKADSDKQESSAKAPKMR
jgi:hypothetical protein